MDELGEASRAQGDWQFKLKRLDGVVLDDQPAFHLAGKPNPGIYMEKFGAIVNDDRLAVTFEFHHGEDKRARAEIVGSVLATVDFSRADGGSVEQVAAGGVGQTDAAVTLVR